MFLLILEHKQYGKEKGYREKQMKLKKIPGVRKLYSAPMEHFHCLKEYIVGLWTIRVFT